ncbi:MAG TPA: hypothetical protein PKI00_02520 [Candidatus Pacearchaeota archaeon]|nr:hypothetical protein [Candidatus Pacearchaeota archaeon]HOC53717.1 hypothetical protein [Candidatus Pacearchaeota archaeon]HQM24744.1 hypothetical protein [Candidatus Pacearchaeota archaeon]
MIDYGFPCEKKLEEFMERKKLYEDATYCFDNNVPKEQLIEIINRFIEKEMIKVETEDLSTAHIKTLKCILCHCINAKKGGEIPKITIIKRKRWKPVV